MAANVAPTGTQVQIALIMLLHGTPAQQQEAFHFLGLAKFLKGERDDRR